MSGRIYSSEEGGEGGDPPKKGYPRGIPGVLFLEEIFIRGTKNPVFGPPGGSGDHPPREGRETPIYLNTGTRGLQTPVTEGNNRAEGGDFRHPKLDQSWKAGAPAVSIVTSSEMEMSRRGGCSAWCSG